MHRPLVAWLLERLYNECAAFYTTVAMWVSHGHWFLWGEAIIPLVDAPVLELGCGHGRLQAALAARGIRAIGLDRSAAMLRRAAAGLPLIRGDARALPCSDATFATVVAVFPAPYIADPHTLAEAARTLRPNGRLVILLSAGAHDVTGHPLWASLHVAGWEVHRPPSPVSSRPLQILIATRPTPPIGAAHAADH